MKRTLKKGNRYKVESFVDPPTRSQSFILWNKVSPVEDQVITILQGEGERGYIAYGLRVKILTGIMKGIITTLPAVRLRKIRVRTKCRCRAFPFPHFPGTTCKP